ncbi:hypothetical protein QNI19_04245 [Cytophagaceae bacterium DM2B3-1]|uniref:Outer membrane protein beta-barrel domain-containing protein n=1 Tax=Xanthocytophaga flava TaxID=3048013 RepID=A0ABT7CHH8_9BACT|nr:hypothetical protein [Xanthocytophaga flavus]MDJ1468955.1 hypothetical protein [Xanthocytophaga flavus]MDJ1492129.1 hypothetical protein [Xanthocytophaga flavus]
MKPFTSFSLRISIFSCILFLITRFSIAQSSVPITISVFNESVAIPFTQGFPTPIHPGMAVGTEIPTHQRTWSSTMVSVNLGYYFHKYLNQALFAQIGYGYEFRSKIGISSLVQMGVGYLHVIRNQPEYSLQDGKYTSSSGIGRSRLMIAPSVDIGFYLKPKKIQSGRIFVRYQPWVEYPFSSGFIPLLPHTNLHLVYKFYPFSK